MFEKSPLRFLCSFVLANIPSSMNEWQIRFPATWKRRRPPAVGVIRFLIVWVLLVGSGVNATSIVVYRTEKEIVIAADSRAITYETDGLSQGIRETGKKEECKIRQIGNVVVSVAGLYDFDPYEAAARSFEGHESLTNKADSFESNLTLWLQVFADSRLRPAFRQQWTERMLRGELGLPTTSKPIPILQVIIAGVEDGKLAYVALSFEATFNAFEFVGTTIRPDRITCPGSCKGIPYYPIARREAIDAILPPINSGEWKSVRPVDMVRFLVRTEIDAVSNEVGGPIDVLRITKKGMTWICQKPGCDKQQSKGVSCKPEKVKVPKPKQGKKSVQDNS